MDSPQDLKAVGAYGGSGDGSGKAREKAAVTKDGVANLGTVGSGLAKELKKGIGGETGYQPPPPVTLPKN